jgi:mannosyltransferase
MNNAVAFLQMKDRKTRTTNIILFLLGITLVVCGTVQSSERIAMTLVGSSASNYQDVLKGALLFRVGLILNGLMIVAIGAFYSPSLGSTTSLLNENRELNEKQGFRNWMPLPVVLAFAAALRVYGSNSCLWYDEVGTLVKSVRLPTHQLITTYTDQNNHPLFSLMAHLSVQLLGESAWTLRLPAILFGLASLWALFLLGRVVTSKREAILATILMVVSYHHVWFSQNARGYTGLLFWGLLSTWLFIEGSQKNKLSIWIAYAASMALGMYTHLTTVFTLASHLLIFPFLLLKQKNSTRHPFFVSTVRWPLISFVFVGLFTFQLYALILPQVVNSFQVQVGSGRVEVWTNPIWAVIEVLNGLQVEFGTFLGIGIVFLVFLIGLVSYARTNYIVVALFVIPLIMGTTVLLVLHRHFYPRFFFFEIGIGVLVLIRGISVVADFLAVQTMPIISRSNLSRIFQTTLASMIIIVSTLSLYYNYRYPKQDYLGALDYVEKNRNEDDIIITAGHASYPYKSYYAPHLKTVETIDEMHEVFAQNKSIWLIYSFPDHLEAFHPGMLSVIQERFAVMKEFPGTLGGGTLFVCKSKQSLLYQS